MGTSSNDNMAKQGVSRRSFLVGVGAAALGLAGLGAGAAFAKSVGSSAADGKASAAAEGTKTVVDCAGRTVEVPTKVGRTVALHPMATHVVWSLGGIDRLVAVDSVFSQLYLPDTATPYFSEEQREALSKLPVTPVWMKGADEEQLLQLAPDVIFTLTGDKNADQLQQDLGIPVVCLYKSPTEKVAESFEVAGQVLDNEDGAAKMADWWNGTQQRISEEVDGIPEDQRPTVMYVGKAGDIMAVPGKDSVYGTVIAAGGGRSVSDEIEDTTSEATDVTMEQMLLWDPDVIICQTADERDTIKASVEWSALRAVQEDNIQVPLQYCGFDGWFSVLGADWMATTLLHDGDADAEKALQKDMADFYDIFYGRELTEDELAEVATNW